MEGANSTPTDSQKPQGRNRRWRNRRGKKPADTTGTAPSEGTKSNGNSENPVKAAGPVDEGSKSNSNKSLAAAAPASTEVINPTEQRPLEAVGAAAGDGTKPKRRNRGGRNRWGEKPADSAGAASNAGHKPDAPGVKPAEKAGPSTEGNKSGGKKPMAAAGGPSNAGNKANGKKPTETAVPAWNMGNRSYENAGKSVKVNGSSNQGPKPNNKKPMDTSGGPSKAGNKTNGKRPVGAADLTAPSEGTKPKRRNRGGRNRKGNKPSDATGSTTNDGNKPTPKNQSGKSDVEVIRAPPPRPTIDRGRVNKGKSLGGTEKPWELKDFRFLDLPLEIRKEIYRLCLPSGYVFDIG
ncbi:hypothetical protein GE09DRAFT_1280049, partial [Coniochaeta sp. 2T2.1]